MRYNLATRTIEKRVITLPQQRPARPPDTLHNLAGPWTATAYAEMAGRVGAFASIIAYNLSQPA